MAQVLEELNRQQYMPDAFSPGYFKDLPHAVKRLT